MSGVTPEDEPTIIRVPGNFRVMTIYPDRVEAVAPDGSIATFLPDLAPVGAPVVDRESLAQAIFSRRWAAKHIWHESVLPSGTELGIDSMNAWSLADHLIASGVVVDRVTVEREQREKDALIVEDVIRNLVNADVSIVAGAVRAGGFAEYRAGER